MIEKSTKKTVPYYNNKRFSSIEVWHNEFKDRPFYSTAYYRAHYRPAYPQEAIDLIAKTYSLHHGIPSGKLVDLACGTGTLTLPLAPFFQHIDAIDIEPEMLAYGKEKGEQAGLSRINWMQGHAESLTGGMRNIKLISIGTAFHWLDHQLVLKKCYNALKPGGGLLVIDNLSFRHATYPAWQQALITLVYTWLKKLNKIELIRNMYPKQMYESPPSPHRATLFF